jgi:large subunit ribosomal protein L31
VFEDQSTGDRWLCRSTATTDRETVWEDGESYPHVVLEVTNRSHPFFTGKMKIVDTAGRVDRFNRRYGERSKRS